MKSVCLLLDETGRAVEQAEYDVAQHLRALGVRVEWHPWQAKDVAFQRFDAVLVRTCCGYHQALPPFLTWMKNNVIQGTRFFNYAATVSWNSDKTYLRDLQREGVTTVPTRFVDAAEHVALLSILNDHDWDEAVVKPTVSAGSQNTWRVSRSTAAGSQDKFSALCARRGMMVQPFLQSVQSEGEISVIYINGVFSHCVRKVPKAGDFRVQGAFGGSMEMITPSEDVLAIGEKCLAAIPSPLLYARVDGVMQGSAFLLMELELIEPNLYLELHPSVMRTYVDGVMARLSPG